MTIFNQVLFSEIVADVLGGYEEYEDCVLFRKSDMATPVYLGYLKASGYAVWREVANEEGGLDKVDIKRFDRYDEAKQYFYKIIL